MKRDMRDEERFEEETVSSLGGAQGELRGRIPPRIPPGINSRILRIPGTEFPGIPKTIEAHFSIVEGGGGTGLLIRGWD